MYNGATYSFSDQLECRPVTHSIYESDEFRMYSFKIRNCPILRSHDWTVCPFAHRGEKARRRDPRRYNYAAVSCPSFKVAGECQKGDSCGFSHGIFEYWLHPDKYRTRKCNLGTGCSRRVCFFAHSRRELRPEITYRWFYVLSPEPPGSRTGRGMIVPVAVEPVVEETDSGRSEIERRLAMLRVAGGDSRRNDQIPATQYSETEVGPDINWVSELIDDRETSSWGGRRR